MSQMVWVRTFLSELHAYREFLNRHRHEVRFPKIELDEAREDDMLILPNVSALDSTTVLQALQELEEPFRVALTLFYLEQFSYQEIANVLEVPIWHGNVALVSREGATSSTAALEAGNYRS
jgi:RNA polymerase sigma-70 factor (ECF subfamily)